MAPATALGCTRGERSPGRPSDNTTLRCCATSFTSTTMRSISWSPRASSRGLSKAPPRELSSDDSSVSGFHEQVRSSRTLRTDPCELGTEGREFRSPRPDRQNCPFSRPGALMAVPWVIGRETNGWVGLSGGGCLCPSVVSAVTGAFDEGVEVGNLADPRQQDASGDVRHVRRRPWQFVWR